jgi:ring-1,2-phenylacetyl-CoA epoxidase subunit PaaD
MHTEEDIWRILENVCDPEVPVLTIQDLGIIRKIKLQDSQSIEITITPTYSGCPAMNTISTQIRMELASHGFTHITILEELSPAWTTDWMTEKGKEKLSAFGITPPQYTTKNNPREWDAIIPCPRCHSTKTELISQFGSTACKALYKCLDCLEPFDYFKCH